jgi:hypothetical protein
MTCRKPARRYRSSYCPEHAIERPRHPLYRQAYLALRLFIAVGSWAAGLCLVIGAVVLVANTSKSGNAVHAAAQAGHGVGVGSQHAASRVGRGAGPDAAAVSPAAGRPPLAQPPVEAPSHPAGKPRAGSWSFSCPARLRTGQLIGKAWYPAGNNHYLVVVSHCSWKLRVVVQRSRPRHR